VFFCVGRVLENGTSKFNDFIAQHDVKTIPGTRSIIIVDIHQVGTSCGFSVPFYDFVGFRDTLNEFFRKKDEKVKAGNEKESMDRYWAFKNAWSMDGLPGMKRAVEAGRREKVEPIKKMVGPWAPTMKPRKGSGGLGVEYAVLVALVSFVLGALTMLYGREFVPFGPERRGMGGGVNLTSFSMDSLPVLGQLKR
jgi:hypothetical protein